MLLFLLLKTFVKKCNNMFVSCAILEMKNTLYIQEYKKETQGA